MFKLTCIFIVIYLIKIVQNQLNIKPTHDSIILRDRFKPFIALCTGQTNTQVVTWQSPLQIDIEENSQKRITVERKGSGLRLRIRNLTEDDQGTWKCLGFDQNEKSISQTFQLNVKIPITFFSQSIQYAELGSSVLIKCQVNANPSAEISWFKGRDKTNLISSNYEQKTDGLKINRVSSIDNDLFWCQADVTETGESKDYQIQVIIAQPITSIKVTCLTPCAVEKRTATLICEANGLPSAEYSWSYGQNVPLMVNGISKFIVRGNRLLINYVDETDNGRYVCHAFNNYDQNGQKKEYLLNVIIPPVLAPIPQIEMNMDENIVSRRVTFSCRVERGSMENLTLEWLYANSTSVQPMNGISIKTSPRLTELIIDPVRREHHGNYTCLVKNSADITSTIARLFVQYKPVYIGPRMNDVYSVPNHPAIMKCQFDSYPSPVIQWRKIIQEHNQMILEDDVDPQVMEILTEQMGPTIYETQLTYDPSEEDFGLKFECRADNSRIEKHFITLRRAKPPGQVQIPRIQPNSNTIELTTELQEPGNLPLLQYVVQYREMDFNSSEKTIVFPVLSNKSQTIVIESLRAATSYRIRIAVESQAGRSDFSTPVGATTLVGDVPQFRLLNNSCLNSTSCLITWFLENVGNSAISKAEISYAKIRSNGKEEKGEKPIQIDGKMTEYELTRLKPNTNYSIVVRLFNKAGFSERKIQKTTNHKITCVGGCPPNIWIILAILLIIIIVLVLFVALVIYVRRKCTDSENNRGL